MLRGHAVRRRARVSIPQPGRAGWRDSAAPAGAPEPSPRLGASIGSPSAVRAVACQASPYAVLVLPRLVQGASWRDRGPFLQF